MRTDLHCPAVYWSPTASPFVPCIDSSSLVVAPHARIISPFWARALCFYPLARHFTTHSHLLAMLLLCHQIVIYRVIIGISASVVYVKSNMQTDFVTAVSMEMWLRSVPFSGSDAVHIYLLPLYFPPPYMVTWEPYFPHSRLGFLSLHPGTALCTPYTFY